MSTQTSKLYPSEVMVQLAGKHGKVMADQLTTVSELRFLNKAGAVTGEELVEIEQVIKLQLDLK